MSNNLQQMLDKIKAKVTNPFLKDNFTLDNIANFFANFVAGNNFVNNLEVKDLAELNKVEIKDILKVKNEAHIENLNFNKLKSRAMSIDDNEITFDPDAVLRLKSSKVAFKVKDVFEVITFMKYIVKICGSKLEKCDFNTLLKNHNANQLMQLINTFEEKHKTLVEKQVEEKKQLDEKKVVEVKKNLKVEPKFKETETNKNNLDAIEKELTSQINLTQNNMMNVDYDKFLQNPDIAEFMNSYYYGLGSQ